MLAAWIRYLKIALGDGISQVNMHQWLVSENLQQASIAVADFLAEKITECLETKDACHVILPGGETPSMSLALLAEKKLPWEKIHWYPGDERVCPVGDLQRNDLMLEKNLWSRLPAGHFHSIPAELGAEPATSEFSKLIQGIHIDIAFLGMGEDGHTASLFPGNAALENSDPVVAVYHSPKPPPERVSFGISVLKDVPVKIVLACGQAKASIISAIKSGKAFPITSVGDVHWFVDQAAVTGKAT